MCAGPVRYSYRSMRSAREQLLEAIDRSDMSDRAVSMAATGSTDTVRNLRGKRSQDPKASTIEALCRALGLEFYIGPPREMPIPT